MANQAARRMTADDVEVGQYVTVLDWYQNREKGPGQWLEPSWAGLTICTGDNRKRDYMGAVLEVVAVSLPYVVARIVSGTQSGQRTVLDLRLVELARLNGQYVEALRPKKKGKKAASCEFTKAVTISFGESPLSDVIQPIADEDEDA